MITTYLLIEEKKSYYVMNKKKKFYLPTKKIDYIPTLLY